MVITTERKRAAPVGSSLVTSPASSPVNSPASSSTGKRSFAAKARSAAKETNESTKESAWTSAELAPELGSLDALVEFQPEVETVEPVLEGVDVQFTSVSKDNSAMLGDAVRQYLVAIGRFPLLSAEQEVMFGRQVEQGQMLLSIQQKLQGDAETPPTLEAWAEAANLTPEQLQKAIQAYHRAVKEKRRRRKQKGKDE